MEAILYADLTTKTLSDSLGGSRFNWPDIEQGGELTIGLRFTHVVDGQREEVSRTVDALRASVGLVDARPTSGTYTLKVGSDASTSANTTGEISYAASATEIQTALNSLSYVTSTYGSNSATVEHKNGSFLIRFDGAVAEAPVAVQDNKLFPVSFVRVRAADLGDAWVHEMRLIQAPVASTAASSRIAPPAPTITELQAGGENSDVTWNEVQKLYIPPEFRGTYQIRRGYSKSTILDPTDGPEEIAAAIAELVDDGGSFEVTNPTANTAHIEFKGDMGGIDQDLMTIQVYDAPEGDLTFTLDFNTNEVAAILRDKDRVDLPIVIEADIQDVNTPSTVYTRKIHSGEITLVRELHYSEISTANNVNWALPPDPSDYVPFSTDQVSNGQLHYSTTIGDGAATSFVLTHNLDTDRVDVILHENAASGEPLVYGTDYTYSRSNSNSLTVTMLGGGSHPTPSSGELLVTVLGLEQTSFFDAHTHVIADITNLQTILDDLGDRLTQLEKVSGTGALLTNDEEAEGAEVASWKFAPIKELYPARVDFPDVESISEITSDMLPRARGLLPAVHDAALEDLPSTIPTAATSYQNRVFINTSGADVALPGGQGHRSATLKDGDYAACDGRTWYQVDKYFADTTTHTDIEAVDTANDELDITGHSLASGDVVSFATDDTLPAPLAVNTAYYVVGVHTDSFSVATTLGGAEVDITSTGTGTHTVINHGRESTNHTTVVTTDYILNEFTGTDTPFSPAVDDRVFFTTTDTLPAGITSNTLYYVKSVYGNTFDVALTSGGAAVAFTDDGTGTHTAHLPDLTNYKTSYYPKAFERELFRFHVNEKQLRLKKTLDLDFAFEAAVLESNTNATWTVAIEVGTFAQDTTPGVPGNNLKNIAWNQVPALEQQIIVTPVTTQHRFGMKVARSLVSSVDTLTITRKLYGATEGVMLPELSDANFAVRARLTRFDTGYADEDASATDHKGVVAIRGLTIDGDSQEADEGRAVIS